MAVPEVGLHFVEIQISGVGFLFDFADLTHGQIPPKVIIIYYTIIRRKFQRNPEYFRGFPGIIPGR
jgi:hypothetical protein